MITLKIGLLILGIVCLVGNMSIYDAIALANSIGIVLVVSIWFVLFTGNLTSCVWGILIAFLHRERKHTICCAVLSAFGIFNLIASVYVYICVCNA